MMEDNSQIKHFTLEILKSLVSNSAICKLDEVGGFVIPQNLHGLAYELAIQTLTRIDRENITSFLIANREKLLAKNFDSPTLTLMEDRIVEMAFLDLKDLKAACDEFGIRNELSDTVFIMYDSQDRSHGLGRGIDPVSSGVIIANAICANLTWSIYFPNLLKKIEKKWKQESKK